MKRVLHIHHFVYLLQIELVGYKLVPKLWQYFFNLLAYYFMMKLKLNGSVKCQLLAWVQNWKCDVNLIHLLSKTKHRLKTSVQSFDNIALQASFNIVSFSVEYKAIPHLAHSVPHPSFVWDFSIPGVISSHMCWQATLGTGV